jgi:hypothetical protein
MRKLLILAVAALLAIAIAAPSFAAETTFEGQYRIRAWSNWNFDKKSHDLADDNGLYTGYFDQRFRLTITHKRSEFLKAVVCIDLVEDTWGQQRNFRINNKTNGALVRKAYIEFALPKVGTFTVGKQPMVLGYGLAFADITGYLDGLKWSNKWGPVGVSAMYLKWDDNASLGITDEAYNRDTDIWLLDAKYTPNRNHTIELFGGYANMRTGYPASHWMKFQTSGLDADIVHSDLGLVGIAYTGEIAGMITLKGEFDYLFGRMDMNNWSGVDDAHLSGYNLYLDASYHNDLLRAGLAFVLGSGQTDDSWGANHYNVNFITADSFAFGNIVGGGVGQGGLNDTWVKGIGFANDIENLTALKLYCEISPIEKLTINAAVIWAQWTEPVGMDTPYYHPIDYDGTVDNYTQGDAGTHNLGWEFDLGLKYQIMEGLTYTFAGGVLLTDDSFDYISGTTREDWGPIWMINNVLTYDF